MRELALPLFVADPQGYPSPQKPCSTSSTLVTCYGSVCHSCGKEGKLHLAIDKTTLPLNPMSSSWDITVPLTATSHRCAMGVSRVIQLADPGSSIEISQTVKLNLPVPGGKLLITDVPFTPCVTGTIVSVGKLFHTGMIPVYKGGNLFFYLPTWYFSKKFKNDVWWLDLDLPRGTHVSAAVSPLIPCTESPPLVPGIEMNPIAFPSSAKLSAEAWHSRRTVEIKHNAPLNLLISNIIGPLGFDPSAPGYLITLQDHALTYTMVFPIMTKAEGPNVLQWWIEFWTVQVGCAPRALWTDKEREFTSLSFFKYLANRGILFVPTLPYSPQKSGKAKCLNQTLGDMARAMTTSCQVPHKFWHLARSLAACWNLGQSNHLALVRLCTSPHHNSHQNLTSAGKRITYSTLYRRVRAGQGTPQDGKGRLHQTVNHLKLSMVDTDGICCCEDKAANGIPHLTCPMLPKSYPVAMHSAEASDWKEACLSELEQMDAWGVCLFKWHTAQFDIRGAYLYSDINNTVYMQPLTEVFPDMKGKVVHLHKALYGMWQAGRCWWKFFSNLLATMGFTPTEVDQSLYTFWRDSTIIVVWNHVDDGLIAANQVDLLSKVRRCLEANINITWSDDLATDIVNAYPRRIVLHNSAPPMRQPDISCLPDDMHTPDLSYAVNMLARHSMALAASHWEVLDHVVGHLSKTRDTSLSLSCSDTDLCLWVDNSWGGNYKRSQTGFLITLGGVPISWGSKRQSVVALSACAAEYVALSESTQHLVQTISELGCLAVTVGKSIHCDNQAAISMTMDNSSRRKMCYLLRGFLFFNDIIRSHNIEIIWVSTSEQRENVLTKPLSGPLMVVARRQLNIT
ncbi:hypothetical protein O181_038673, partial [Austropuccinia psidii MF-1]|nr:hypothetical protein [Austropuccinia psidii MF-1]